LFQLHSGYHIRLDPQTPSFLNALKHFKN